MSYLIYFGIVVAAGGVLLLVSDAFAHSVSRGVEALFERVEYRLALRAREQQTRRRDTRVMNTTAVRTATTLRVVAGQRKGSTQQLGVARVAAEIVEARVNAPVSVADRVFFLSPIQPEESVVSIAEQRIDDGDLISRHPLRFAARDEFFHDAAGFIFTPADS